MDATMEARLLFALSKHLKLIKSYFNYTLTVTGLCGHRHCSTIVNFKHSYNTWN